jgi:hypothetical protein
MVIDEHAAASPCRVPVAPCHDGLSTAVILVAGMGAGRLHELLSQMKEGADVGKGRQPLWWRPSHGREAFDIYIYGRPDKGKAAAPL